MLLALSLFQNARGQESHVSCIDTRVGTAASETKTAGRFGKGTEEYAHTLPAVLEPNGMNFWTPQTAGATEAKGVCPYLYKEDRLYGLRCSHWIVGGCTQDYGSFTIFPTSTCPDSLSDFSSTYSHDSEVATPAYYAATLDDSQIRMEMTGRSRSAMFRFTYKDLSSAYLVVTVNSDENEGFVDVDEQKGIIWGKNPIHRIYQGKGKPTGASGWFVVRLQSGQIASHGRIDRQRVWIKLNGEAKGSELASNSISFAAASSFVSVANASDNLAKEIPHNDFDRTRHELTDIWEKHLSCIRVESENIDEIGKFYGSLYRASFLPHVINDCNGDYPHFSDGTKTENILATNTSGNPTFTGSYYDDFSMWDTYRALHPLLNIISPKKNGEMMQSLVMKYEQGGWLPIFPCWNSYTAAMIGDHCTSVLADAYVKGVRNFDARKAYDAMHKNAFETPATYEEYSNGMGRRALQSYMQYGYIPLEDSVREAYHQQEQVSRTMEYAYDDYALAQMAKMLMNDERYDADSRKQFSKDYKMLMERSHNWANIIDKRSGWANGRHADGSFTVASDTEYIKEPEKHPEATELTPYVFSTFITEGTPCHYTWYVPHDVAGLVKAMGGKKAFEAKLDEMFRDGLYWHGNEPCHQIAYLYNYIGRPWKTQKAVRHILETEYLNKPGGLSGNDDAGQMSAWYIFSALGLYPVCPGTPYYSLSSPVFSKAEIRLENGKTFTIVAKNASPENIYVKSVSLNGKRLKRMEITHEDIMQGGTLTFEMGE